MGPIRPAVQLSLTALLLTLSFNDAPSGTITFATIAQASEANDRTADQLLQQGIDQFDAGQLDTAFQTWQQSLQRYRQISDRKGEGEALRYIGRVYYFRKALPQALQNFQQSLAIAREVKNLQGEGKTLSNLGVVYAALNEADKAIEHYRHSIKIAQAVSDQKTAGISFNNLAFIYQDRQDWPQSIKAWQSSLSIWRELNDQGSTFVALKNLGVVYGRLDKSEQNSEKALAYSTEGLRLAEKLGDQRSIGDALRDIGILHMTYNRVDPASEHFQKSLAIWRKIKNPAMEGNVLALLGGLYASRFGSNGEDWCPESINYYEQSLPIIRQLKNQSLEVEILGNLGFCYEETNNYSKAIEYQKLSLALARQTQNSRREGIALIHLGRSYQSIGRLSQARKSAEQGLDVVRAIKSRDQEVFGLETLSNIYVASAEHRKAIEAQTERIVIAQQYKVKTVEGGFNAVSVNIEQAKKFDPAKSIQQDYQLYHDRLKTLGFAIASIKLTEANITEFMPHIKESWLQLGDAYFKTHDYSRALAFYQAGLDQDFDKGYSFSFFDIKLLGKIGNTLAQTGQFTEAESMLRLALNYGEIFRTGLGYSAASSNQKEWTDTQRIALAERQVKDFQELQQVLVRQNKTDTALELSEESRARTFVELLSARIAARPLGKNLPAAPKLDEIRQIAKAQDATLVQYSLAGPDLLYIWVIKPDGEIAFKSVDLKEASLKELVAQNRQRLGVRASIRVASNPDIAKNADNQELRELHKLLIEPIASELPTNPDHRVIFIPQGEIFLVPFPALKNAQGQYLIEQHTLSTAPSIQTLGLLNAQRQTFSLAAPAVVVGNPTMPVFGTEQLQPLPGAEQEARSIAKIFKTQALTGHQATKAEVLKQMQSASIVHLATHGLLDTVQGDIPGAIALARSTNDNGLLSASEIFDLKLKANLVVLSACDTGRGDIKGDGVIGLSRSFVAAGVPSVVVSLWTVDDASTSSLMSEFYQNLQVNPNKAKALRQAMLTTMKQYPKVADWAAFTLIGES